MKNLAKKISEVIAAVKHPPQSGHNKFHGYSYSTRDDIFGVIRHELAARGVAVLPEVVEVIREGGDKVGGMTRIIVKLRVTLADGESGETATQAWEGESHTKDEKGVQQAVTQALRFWAVNTFMLLDGSDEQMYGQPGTQTSQTHAQPVHRQSAPPADPREGLRKRLAALNFNSEAFARFGAYIARVERVAAFEDVPRSRLNVWLNRMSLTDDVQAAAKIKQILEGAA